MSILVVIPSYGQMGVTSECVQSAFNSLPPDTRILLIDDFSPDWNDKYWKDFPKDRLIIKRRTTRTGSMTKAWNEGLLYARDHKSTIAILANSDLVFPQGWWDPVRTALVVYPHHLLGPLSNAPGSCPEQNIKRALPLYQADATQDAVDGIQSKLSETVLANKIEKGSVNGFCLVAHTATWFLHAHSPGNPFNPEFKMNGNEYDWQKRAEKCGKRSIRVLGSFVFHYRGMSRGLTGSYAGYYRKRKQ